MNHVDPARASTGPFGATIAPGYLTLSLNSALLWEVLEVTDSVQVINYGLDKGPVSHRPCQAAHRWRWRSPSNTSPAASAAYGLDVPHPRFVETGLCGRSSRSNFRLLRPVGKRSGPG